MPESYPDFPHHTHIAAYFDKYVDHSASARRSPSRPAWSAPRATRRHVERGARHRRDAALRPRCSSPTDTTGTHLARTCLPGSESFTGLQVHAHSYRDNSIFEGKHAVILGMGNSAMDIAVSPPMSPSDLPVGAPGRVDHPEVHLRQTGGPDAQRPARAVQGPQRITQALIRGYAGPPERYGLPKPNHRFGEAHPTISGRILDRIQHGTITPKPNIDSFEGSRVKFVDGGAVEADVVVYCTGYKITFPFFEEDLICAPDNRIEPVQACL